MKNTLFKKGLVVGIIVLFICLAFIPSFNAVSISKDIGISNPVIVVHVTELYGTIEHPQYRNLPNVTVKITVIPRWWEIYWNGKTHENGTTDKVNVELGFLYRVSVSKDNYLVYKDEPYQAVGPYEIKEYHVYFTMVKEKVKDIENDCDCQSKGKTHLAEKLLNRLEKNEVIPNDIDLSNKLTDRPLCMLFFILFSTYAEKAKYCIEKLEETKGTIWNYYYFYLAVMYAGICYYYGAFLVVLDCLDYPPYPY